MKKRFILICVLLSVLCCFSFIIVGVAIGLFDNDENDVYNLYAEENEIEKYVEYLIEKGRLDISENTHGYVEYNENTVVYISKTISTENGQILCEIGQNVKKDEVIYQDKKTSIKSPVDGRVVDIDASDTIDISIVNFSESAIKVSIPEIYQNKINSLTQIYGQFDGSEQRLLNIISISPVIENGFFDIYLENNFEAYNMTKIDISIKYEERESVVMIPIEYVKADSAGRKYINILDTNKSVKKVYILVGQGNADMIEIVDGEFLIGKIAIVNKEELMLKDSD